MELRLELKNTFMNTARKLKGSDRRIFMAEVVQSLGKGGQTLAAKEFHWGRNTIRKGLRELESGIRCLDNFSSRGRKPAEYHLPNLLKDIQSIADQFSQTDPSFKSSRLYTRLSASEVHQQLITHYGYAPDKMPSEETIRLKLNQMDYHLKKVQKTKPKKKQQKRTIFLMN